MRNTVKLPSSAKCQIPVGTTVNLQGTATLGRVINSDRRKHAVLEENHAAKRHITHATATVWDERSAAQSSHQEQRPPFLFQSRQHRRAGRAQHLILREQRHGSALLLSQLHWHLHYEVNHLVTLRNPIHICRAQRNRTLTTPPPPLTHTPRSSAQAHSSAPARRSDCRGSLDTAAGVWRGWVTKMSASSSKQSVRHIKHSTCGTSIIAPPSVRVSGERPIGAASWRQQHNQVPCPPHPPPPRHQTTRNRLTYGTSLGKMPGTAAYHWGAPRNVLEQTTGKKSFLGYLMPTIGGGDDGGRQPITI